MTRPVPPLCDLQSVALVERARPDRARSLVRPFPLLAARVFLSVGAEEEHELFEEFVTILEGRMYKQLELRTHIFDGETQASVGPATISRTLRFLYPIERKRE